MVSIILSNFQDDKMLLLCFEQGWETFYLDNLDM